MRNLVERAKALAYRAHQGQVDKAGRPYIEHVARVAAASRIDGHLNCPGCDQAEAVGWLHDILEDQGEFWGDEVYTFPHVVTYSCVLLDRDSAFTEDAYYSGIRSNGLALRVKLADIADNANEERLALLDPKTANRLREKYRKALEALTC